VFAALAVGPLPSTGASAATDHRFYKAPFDGDGAPTVEYERRRGNACSPSYINGAVDAFRCYASGHLIFDPCFDRPTEEGELLCVATPWATEGVLLSGADVDYSRDRREARIWAMKLRNGMRCSFLSGGTAWVRGAGRLNYICGKRKFFLWGNPDRSRSIWTIRRTGPTFSPRRFRRSRIAVAWS
jgi:hypothetical protein